MSREGRGRPVAHFDFGLSVADLRISPSKYSKHLKNIHVNNMGKPLLCRISPRQSLENHLLSLWFYKGLYNSSEGRPILRLLVSCLMSGKFLHLHNSPNIPPEETTSNAAHLWQGNPEQFIEQAHGAFSLHYLHPALGKSFQAKFSKAQWMQGGLLEGKT